LGTQSIAALSTGGRDTNATQTGVVGEVVADVAQRTVGLIALQTLRDATLNAAVAREVVEGQTGITDTARTVETALRT
jgi:hypothetical protein